MSFLDQAEQLLSRGLLEAALQTAKSGLALEAHNKGGLCGVAGAAAFALGDEAQAEKYWRESIAADPKSAGGHHNLGVLLAGRGDLPQAEAMFRRAIELGPRFAEAHVSLGRCLAESGRPEEAESVLRKALALDALHPEAHFYLGKLLFEAGHRDEAERSYRQALVLVPDFAEALNNLGDLLASSGRSREAEEHFARAVAADPGLADAYYNLGNALAARGALDEAEHAYRNAIAGRRGFAQAQANLALVLDRRGLRADAEQELLRAIAVEPRSPDAFFNLGNVLAGAHRVDEAEQCYRRALELGGEQPDPLVNLGNLLMSLRRYDEAESVYRRALAADAGRTGVLPLIILAAGYTGDWTRREDDLRQLRALLADPARDIQAAALLSVPDVSALEQKRAAQTFAAHATRAPGRARDPSATDGCAQDRLRIGYLSAHFYRHTVGEALAGVLEAHDRGSVSVHGYYYGAEAADATGERIRASCETFRDVRALGDEAVAAQIAADRIDILVDLVGYTGGFRSGIARARPAPIVASWLGYPGTLGDARMTDYLIGDPVVTPLEHAEHFTETLALMPHCYHPYDSRRAAGASPSRAEAGLPQEGFVFCNLSQCYKINPETLDVWCRLLREVPGSVLWLQRPANPGMDNLRREAAARGVDPARLVFAERVDSVSEYLGRLRLADLALDSYPYGSHSSGCDVLRAGVPLLTRVGEPFASRVAASLLAAVGLQELIARDWDEYLSLAKALALDGARLGRLRAALKAASADTPLFDPAGFARDLERLYREMCERHRRGDKSAIVLAPSGG
jgi:predicted O-linked N-acetylglucosamine transferase (SPINDLY family)